MERPGCLGYGLAPGYIDWWKMWELHAGLNLGILYVIVLNWGIREVDRTHAPDGTPYAFSESPMPGEGIISGFLGLSGFVLVFAAGYEYFFWTGLCLAAFYAVTVCLAHGSPGKVLSQNQISQRRRSMALAYSAFLLVFMLLHGGTSRLGVILELYSPDAVDQYEWPSGRVWLMIAGSAILLVVTLTCIRKMFAANIRYTRMLAPAVCPRAWRTCVPRSASWGRRPYGPKRLPFSMPSAFVSPFSPSTASISGLRTSIEGRVLAQSRPARCPPRIVGELAQPDIPVTKPRQGDVSGEGTQTSGTGSRPMLRPLSRPGRSYDRQVSATGSLVIDEDQRRVYTDRDARVFRELRYGLADYEGR